MAIKGITNKYRNKKPIAFIDELFIYGFENDNNRDLNIVFSYGDSFTANRIFKDKDEKPYFVHRHKKYYVYDLKEYK